MPNIPQKRNHLITLSKRDTNEGVQKVFGTLDLFVSLLETEIKYPILQGGILPFWTPSFYDLENQISIPIIFLNS